MVTLRIVLEYKMEDANAATTTAKLTKMYFDSIVPRKKLTRLLANELNKEFAKQCMALACKRGTLKNSKPMSRII